ncbi:P-loop containing nucleoside triphosphate hydrolase protein [Cantharellus anzutake]|uniref:P-loop containing nucleoside triphosphate hydrolase protein n=1 Tax=Cantharellus anzutake TaxID=1750568 RepID=UPI00190462E6|nr:P-loop containing nucleoside triphosphate hydrolase protein [Cantharellus anzutake]KAF8326819.1 P-loop containing nucleoside triphosphate hydrolase protein [Cantharellus anzutake]
MLLILAGEEYFTSSSCQPSLNLSSRVTPQLSEPLSVYAGVLIHMQVALARPPSWYPGHMAAFAKALPSLLANTNVVLEVRDSRLPLTSINPALEKHLEEWRIGVSKAGVVREQIVVHTKKDLVPSWGEERLRRALSKHYKHLMHFTSPSSPPSIRALHSTLVSLWEENADKLTALNVLVVGMPNIGKSTLLNALRGVGTNASSKNPLRTSPLPGYTRSLSTRLRLSSTHPIYSIDSPGIMIPFLGHGEEGKQRGIKLALIAGIKESLYDDEALAKYLIWRLWKDCPEWPAYNSLMHPTSSPHIILPDQGLQGVDTHAILERLANRLKAVQKGGFPDIDRAASYLVRWWRAGNHHRSSDTRSSLYYPSNPPTPTPNLVRSWGFDFDFERPIELKPLPSLEDAGTDPIQIAMNEVVQKYIEKMGDQGGIGMSVSMTKRNELKERKRRKVEKWKKGES